MNESYFIGRLHVWYDTSCMKRTSGCGYYDTYNQDGGSKWAEDAGRTKTNTISDLCCCCTRRIPRSKRSIARLTCAPDEKRRYTLSTLQVGFAPGAADNIGIKVELLR